MRSKSRAARGVSHPAPGRRVAVGILAAVVMVTALAGCGTGIYEDFADVIHDRRHNNSHGDDDHGDGGFAFDFSVVGGGWSDGYTIDDFAPDGYYSDAFIDGYDIGYADEGWYPDEVYSDESYDDAYAGDFGQ